MRANNVLGLIYSNAYDSALPEFTSLRTMGSVPFGGRYRLIDFVLSNMVNCGMSKVGIVTKNNYQSLLDHIGSGKPWDLSRKNEGLFILPPFASRTSGVYENRIEALKGNMRFMARSNEEYVILSDCNVICNMDFTKLFDAHTRSGADITIVYKNGPVPKLDDLMTFGFGADGRVNEIMVNRAINGDANYSLNMFIMRKSLLQRLINEAMSLHFDSFERDIFQRNVLNLNIRGYEEKGFVRVINGLKSYFDANLDLLVPENRRELFKVDKPVYTKVHDEVPAKYGLGSEVRNSLVADGCIIDGTVENCILFRGVRIGKGAVVKNSIIMQGTMISENVSLDCTVIDKSAVIKPGKTLIGDKSYPIYIGKEIII
ncbi:MAG: glucose-1-phosphate adenylyltransferase subunit GlgD [Clostridiales bacterium]|nr:glucose-1-phosphate adenylyltransferase subunit GlgD [Clostridiales bacterium]